MAEKQVTVTFTTTEALALLKIADTGLRVVEALNLVQSTAAAERAINLVRRALPAR